MKVWLPHVAVASLALCMVAAEGEDGPTDLDRLQGTWTMVSFHEDGEELPVEAGNVVFFYGKRMTTTPPGGRPIRASLELMPEGEPKRMNIYWGWRVTRAAYSLDGDRLTICYLHPESRTAPKKMLTPHDRGTIAVYERVNTDSNRGN